MIYGPGNAAGATVRFADTNTELRQVFRVDTDAATVERGYYPARLNAAGDAVDTFTERFDAIHAIQGLEPHPTLFICYGRKP